jgi:hypothetical protein
MIGQIGNNIFCLDTERYQIGTESRCSALQFTPWDSESAYYPSA